MNKQPTFPNKMIQTAYNDALGKTFTWSPTNQLFTDLDGNSDYNYQAMIWLKTNSWLEESFDKNKLVWLFTVRKR